MSITVKNVFKQFGAFTALDNVSLEVPDGALLALLGPSGSGKTTLLRIIAGLETPDEGAVLYHDDEITHRSPRDRNVGFVFQHYALFRHMTVFENVAFALRVRRQSNAEVMKRVTELLHLVRLENLGSRYPQQLSGGQRQRVALARALSARPKVLLLDEPFGALDVKVRQELRQWLRRLHDEYPVTSVFVTHDQEEAFEVSDKVVVMRAGRVEQVGTPQEVFDHPANAFVMDFLGNVNVFPGRVLNGQTHLGPGDGVNGHEATNGEPTKVYVRPHELDVDRQPIGVASLKAKVLHLNPAGAVVKVALIATDFGFEVQVELSRARHAELTLKPGEVVFVAPNRMRVFVQELDYAI